MQQDWYSSDREQEKKTQSHRLVELKQVAIILMLLAVMASMLVPVWQSAVNRALDVEFRTISTTVKNLQEQQRLLQSQIAQKTMPEALAEGAWKEDILLQQINADSLIMIGRKI